METRLIFKRLSTAALKSMQKEITNELDIRINKTSTDVNSVGLGVRVLNLFKAHDIEHIEDLTVYYAHEVQAWRSCDKRSFYEMKAKLLEYGLNFK